jgi:hypothetical protein
MNMRYVVGVSLFAFLSAVVAVGSARAADRTRRFDSEGTIVKVTPATDAEKKDGILATITFKDREITVQITKETELQIAKGKLVEKGSADDLKKDDRISVWFEGKPDKSDPPRVKAERVMIFRAGKPDLPPVPPRDK